MLRLIQIGQSLPFSWPVDSASEFEPGMVGQLNLSGNQITCGVSDGTAPIGIIDDIKKESFSSVSIDEVIIASIPEVIVDSSSGTRRISIDVMKDLDHASIRESSFVSNPVDVVLNPTNGIITFVAGTALNFDMDGDGIPDSIRTVVSYTFTVPNVPGDNSTIGTGRITIWWQRIIFATDMFETNQKYPLNHPLFVSESGLLTSRRIQDDYPAIAIVTGPPTVQNKSIEAMLL